MTVVFVTGHDIWGSGFSPMRRIMLHLATRGHRVVLLTHRKDADPSTDRYGAPTESLHPNMIVHRFPLVGDRVLLPRATRIPVLGSLYVRFRSEVLLPLALYREFFRRHLDRDADLIYGYEIFGALPAYWIARRLGKPLVLRFQGTLLYPVLRRAQDSLLGKALLLRWWIHMRALRLPAALKIMTNDGTRGDWVLERLGNTSPYVFWYNGIDILRGRRLAEAERDVLRSTLGIPPRQKVMVSASRLENWKRVDRIIAALPAVVSKVPDVHYYIIGSGEMESVLRAQAGRLGVQGHISFVGTVEHERVFTFLAAADVFVSAYDISNVGNPLMEAMVCGAPIVTLDVGDTRHVITDGVDGYLLAPDDVGGMADRVVDLLSNEGRRQAFREAGFAKAAQLFWSWDERLEAEEVRLRELVSDWDTWTSPRSGGQRAREWGF